MIRAADVKRSVTMTDLLARLDIPIRSGFIVCPFHAEVTGSCRVWDDPNKGFYCFGCHLGGSVIDFAMHFWKLNFAEAMQKLAGMFGLDTSRPQTVYERSRQAAENNRRNRELNRVDLLEDALVQIEKKIVRLSESGEISDELVDALEHRSMLENKIQEAYDDRWLKKQGRSG